ncbi:MAG: DnaJ domain-containing protein [Parvularculaceae bacterium]|nr:DnaJ domain-containing protein [Parvularculaceae bacterium]
MFEKNTTARHKNEHRVIVALTGQAPFEAFVFLKVNERLIDLLNDQRQFIPIKRADGATLIASKRNIVSIIEQVDEPREEPSRAETRPEAASADEAAAPKDAAKEARPGAEDEAQADQKPAEDKPGAEEAADHGRKRRRFDPYEILRIARDSGPEEIRRAYHARMRQVHPDAIASLSLDEDLERAANISARRVNRAYQMLMREKAEQARAEEETAA